MTYQVSGADLKTIRLSEQDTVSSVLHNVALILATVKGTVPLYRDFGLHTKLRLQGDVKGDLVRVHPRVLRQSVVVVPVVNGVPD